MRSWNQGISGNNELQLTTPLRSVTDRARAALVLNNISQKPSRDCFSFQVPSTFTPLSQTLSGSFGVGLRWQPRPFRGSETIGP